jgi:glycosyltransferase involved in cell wall biosynthesis
MQTPLVSIALCTYNGERYLKQQLDTLLGQSYPNLEIVIVDDLSKDNTIAILEQYAAKFPNIRITLNEKNLGYVKNFEKAISLCKGEYIAMADQDDVWALNKIELLIHAIGDNLLVYHDSEFVNENSKPIGKNMSGIMAMYSGNHPLVFLLNNCVSGHACMFKKQLTDKVQRFNTRFPHDWYLAFLATCYGGVLYVDQALVQYRQHSTANTDILSIKDGKAVKKAKLAYINVPWLRAIAPADQDHEAYINKVADVYEGHSFLRPLRLMALLIKHQDDLFYIKNKNKISRFNLIRKIAFSSGTNYSLA